VLARLQRVILDGLIGIVVALLDRRLRSAFAREER
jgi:hypothetical protein